MAYTDISFKDESPRAMGRNGDRAIRGLFIEEGARRLRVFPVTKKRGIIMNCYIDIPTDRDTLTQLSNMLLRLLNDPAIGKVKRKNKEGSRKLNMERSRGG